MQNNVKIKIGSIRLKTEFHSVVSGKPESEIPENEDA